MLETIWFEIFSLTLIMANFVACILETNEEALCKPSGDCGNSVYGMFNLFILVAYTLEALLKFYIYRNEMWRDVWNIFDALILLSSYSGEIIEGFLPGVAILRVLRLARLCRILRIL